jgi:GTP-binding protein
VIDVDEEHSGTVVEKMSERKAEMTDMRPSGGGKTRLTFYAPTRGLIGYQGEFLTDTRGTGIMNRCSTLRPYKGEIQGRKNGVLISNGAGRGGRLCAVEARGARHPMMIEPGEGLRGMIVGEQRQDNDLEVNPEGQAAHQHPRHLGKDDAVRLTPPIKMTLEQALAYIEDDELVEVTPKSIRLRKRTSIRTSASGERNSPDASRGAGVPI